MKIEGACHPVIPECHFNSMIFPSRFQQFLNIFVDILELVSALASATWKELGL